MKRVILGVVALVTAAIFIRQLPDLLRYLKISRM